MTTVATPAALQALDEKLQALYAERDALSRKIAPLARKRESMQEALAQGFLAEHGDYVKDEEARRSLIHYAYRTSVGSTALTEWLRGWKYCLGISGWYLDESGKLDETRPSILLGLPYDGDWKVLHKTVTELSALFSPDDDGSWHYRLMDHDLSASGVYTLTLLSQGDLRLTKTTYGHDRVIAEGDFEKVAKRAFSEAWRDGGPERDDEESW